MNRFEGKTIWITGAAKGIGQCAAIEFAREGGKVIATDVDTDGLSTAFADHPDLAIETMAQDVTDSAEWERLGQEVIAKHGKLDVLVNNAGIADFTGILDITPEKWRKTNAVNADGMFFGTQTGIRLMKETGGAIVNVVSIAGIASEMQLTDYCASKGSTNLMTKTAAVECAATGIPVRINCLNPGYTATPLVSNAMEKVGDQAEAITNAVVSGIPLGRLANPIEIARPLLFLASDDASYMVGSELVVDGGRIA